MSRLPFKACRMLLYDLDDTRYAKLGFYYNVRCKLYEYGFGNVLLNQGVGGMNQFLHAFRERLIACRWQDWDYHVQHSDMFSVYRTFCIVHDMKTYRLLNIDKHKVYIGYLRHRCTSLPL